MPRPEEEAYSDLKRTLNEGAEKMRTALLIAIGDKQAGEMLRSLAQIISELEYVQNRLSSSQRDSLCG